jgi:hypothetical protein
MHKTKSSEEIPKRRRGAGESITFAWLGDQLLMPGGKILALAVRGTKTSRVGIAGALFIPPVEHENCVPDIGAWLFHLKYHPPPSGLIFALTAYLAKEFRHGSPLSGSLD